MSEIQTNSSLKTFLITGAAHGLGQEIARQLSAENHQLILLDKDKKQLNVVYEELSLTNENIYLFPMDLIGSSAEEFALLQQGLADFPQLDGLILNAGFLPGLTPIANLDPVQWYEILQTNLNANFHLIQTCLPWLQNAIKQHNQAWLCGISDKTTQGKQAYFGAYAVAKAGLEQLIKLTALENPGLTGIISRQPGLVGHFRAKIYPAENPNHNPNLKSYQQAAAEILQACFEQKPTQDIEFIQQT